MAITTDPKSCEWPQRINGHRILVGRKSAGSVSVNGLWDNPFPVVDGDAAAAVLQYRFWLASHPERIDLAREQLADKTLRCSCGAEDCHAEALFEVADLDTEVLLMALRLGAEADQASRAITLIAEWPGEYLDHEAVRDLIGAVTAPALPVARVDWDALARTLMVEGFAVPAHVAATWAFAAHLAIETPIAVERALSEMDAFTAMRAMDLFWEGSK
jgi:hypothetical protein